MTWSDLRRATRFVLWLAVIGYAVTRAAGATQPSNVTIGVLAFRGPDRAIEKWQPTADYLSGALPGREFRIVALPLDELANAVARRAFDFLLTNSGNYVVLEHEFGISRIATLKRAARGEVRNRFGAIVFTRSDREDLATLDDLSGQRFVAVSATAFGGFQMAWREFKQGGLDPFTDFSGLRFLGLPQDLMVYAVRDGEADAGTVRTGVLETMAAEGKIHLPDFKILNGRDMPGYGYGLSTRLYPEWPFAKLRETSDDLSAEVAIALLTMPGDHPAARVGGYSGWTVPLDYQPIHDLFRELGIGPYRPADTGLWDIAKRHWEWAGFVAVILVLVILHGVRTEYLVARRTRELSEQIVARERFEERARRHEAELAHVSRLNVMGEMASGLAHELNQPLSAIRNYARGCVDRLGSASVRPEELRGAMEQVMEQAGRAGQIISRIRGFVRKSDTSTGPVDINQAVREVAELLAADARVNGVELRLDLTQPLPPAMADIVEIEQVVLNLARNGFDAMRRVGEGRRRLTLATRRRGQDLLEVVVEDTGPGMEPEIMGRAWEPFFTSKPEGLGLGLSICRSIIESHGGEVSLSSELGVGTRFVFTLPSMERGLADRSAANRIHHR